MGDVIERLNAALEGRYRIDGEIGEGGMATVYLAEDLKHHRKVALKVLKPELAAVVGAERFLAEIETTANLSHPNILPLFDSGEADGFLFYVMPYVEGESLRERLAKEKQLPVTETVRIATDVAEALDHAHRHGVIHRDVKPANVLLQDGRPVVADFGIALAVSQAGGGRLTETGLSLGTPYYMSPEQATGDREVDARSDTYALACVVYEMLTGEPPFSGTTAQAVLGRILMGEVDPPTVHRKAIPANVEAAVLKALEKLPADRFASAKELADALNNPAFRYDRVRAGRGAATGAGGPLLRGRGAAKVAAAAAVAVAAVAGWAIGGRSEPATVERHRILLGSGPEQISELVAFRAALHPDGAGIVFADTALASGRTTLRSWWKPRGDLEATRVPSLDGAITPTFSPDGSWLLFVQNGELRKQPLMGGNSVTLVPSVAGGTAHALAWLDNGTIVFENAGFIIQQIPEDGQGEPVTISTEERTGQPIHMSGLPGGWGVLVSACVNSCPAGTMLSVFDLEADTVVKLADDVVRAWPAPEGRIVYLTRAGGVFAAPFDRDELRMGPPAPLLSGVRVSPDANGEMHVAPDGRALYVRGSASAGSYVPSVVDRTGRATGFNRASFPPRPYSSITVSRAARKVAVTIAGTGGEQLWVADVTGGPLVPLTPNETSASRPDWFADGSRIAYVSLEGDRHVRSIRADGTSPAPDTLFTGAVVYEVELTARDTFLIRVSSAEADVYLVDPNGDGEPVPLLTSPARELAVTLSPDRRWLAYVSDVSGRAEVYVRPFPDVSGGQVAVSLNGGVEPEWAPDGSELFYRDGTGWMVAAEIDTTGSGLRVAGRQRLFDASAYAIHNGWRGYDVLPDGQFLMLEPGPGTVAEVGNLVLVDNLFREVEGALEQ